MTHAIAEDVVSLGEIGGVRTDVAVAFTDLEGFTAFTAPEGDDAAGRLLIDRHRHADRLARRRGGRVVKHLGDGLLLVFASAPAAVITCLELRETAPLRLRAGVHQGSVNMTVDDDVVGHVVNLAARVAASARPGELLVTDDVRIAAAALSCLVFDAPTIASLQGHGRPGVGERDVAHRMQLEPDGSSLSCATPRTSQDNQPQETTMITPGIDHIALNVPDLDAQIERLTTAMGLVVEHRFGDFALISDPSTGLKVELGRSQDDQVHFRHFGFCAADLDSAHQHLVDSGMETTEEPHRRDFAAMYTSFLRQTGCVDVQLVTYDQPVAPVGPAPHDALTSTGGRG